jgi:hypothetical protein
MAKEQVQAPAASAGDTLEKWIAARQGLLSVGLLAVAALFAVLCIVQLVPVFRSDAGNMPVTVWAGVLALLCLFGGLYLQFDQGTAHLPAQDGRYRLLALALGGGAGLITFILGIWLPLGPWASYFVPAPAEAGKAAAPLLQVWRENWWRIAVCGLSVIGGLALMFMSLQLARSVERASAGMRRLLYGYNAALTGLLLLAILGLLNVLAYVHLWPFTLFAKSLDWTPSQTQTLSQRSIEILQKETPGELQLIVLMPNSDPKIDAIDQLVKNVRKYKRVGTAFLDPHENHGEFMQVRLRFGKLIDPSEFFSPEGQQGKIGMVVLYREEGKEEAEFIPYRQMFAEKEDRRAGGATRFLFKGESKLMNALAKLTQKTPAKVVFTSGHGELSLAGARPEDGISQLKRMLQARGNYEIKEVKLGVEGGKGLEDADVVVVARPTEPFSPKALDALRSYVSPTGTSKKGKLIVLLDTQVRNRVMLKTGVEGLLEGLGVQVSERRLLSDTNTPQFVRVTTKRDSDNPVARAFGGIYQIHLPMQNARRVEGKSEGNLKVDTLLETAADIPVWEESNLVAPAADLVAAYPPDKKALEKVPVAVAVSEGNPTRSETTVPRAVVFGNSFWVSDQALVRGGSYSADLFASCISWLRGKSDLGVSGIDDKEENIFTLQNKEVNVSRLTWLPLALVFISIVGLGGGIWLTRRR